MPNIAFNEADAFPPKITDTINDRARKDRVRRGIFAKPTSSYCFVIFF